MSAYLVLMQEVDDVERYRNEYLPGVRPFLQKYGAELVVGGFDTEPVEGEPPNSTVVIRFADSEAAWGFLNDPDYQPVKEIRFSTTSRGQMVLAPEFTPAGWRRALRRPPLRPGGTGRARRGAG
jgi:uncharacterized protein (DUF1330 family)